MANNYNVLNSRQLCVIFLSILLIIFLLLAYNNPKNERVLESNELFITDVGFDLLPSNRLFNLTNFKYNINNSLCSNGSGKNMSILLVTSYAGNVETRSAIRQAYPQELLSKLGIIRVFMLAMLKDSHVVTQDALLNENNRFKDILQGNFYEDYKNLTYKHMMGLYWAGEYCSQALYIFKMDDDIAVNFYKINETFKYLPHNNYIAGYVLDNMKPKREPKNKWYVSKKEYSSETYPKFLSGWFYITTPKTVRLLYIASLYEKFFWIDDLLITGIMREKFRIQLINMNKYYTSNTEYLECCLTDESFECDYIIGPTSGNNKLLLNFKKLSEFCFNNKCKERSFEKLLKKTCVAKWKNEIFGSGTSLISPVPL